MMMMMMMITTTTTTMIMPQSLNRHNVAPGRVTDVHRCKVYDLIIMLIDV